MWCLMIFPPLCLQLRGRLNHQNIGQIYVLKTPHTSWWTHQYNTWAMNGSIKRNWKSSVVLKIGMEELERPPNSGIRGLHLNIHLVNLWKTHLQEYPPKQGPRLLMRNQGARQGQAPLVLSTRQLKIVGYFRENDVLSHLDVR
jgi:hypothetical protein